MASNFDLVRSEPLQKGDRKKKENHPEKKGRKRKKKKKEQDSRLLLTLKSLCFGRARLRMGRYYVRYRIVLSPLHDGQERRPGPQTANRTSNRWKLVKARKAAKKGNHKKRTLDPCPALINPIWRRTYEWPLWVLRINAFVFPAQ